MAVNTTYISGSLEVPATALTGLTASKPVFTDASKVLTSTGTVPVAQGGTGATTLTANNVILGNTTSAVQFVAPGTSGNVLQSNGTTWTSAAITAVTGSGTTATIPKWSSSSALTDSNITINATGNPLVTAVAPANAGAAFLTTVTMSSSAGTYYNGRFSTTAPSSSNAVSLYGMYLPINGGSLSSASAVTVGIKTDNQTTVGTAAIDGWNFTGTIGSSFTARAANTQTNGGNIGVTSYAGGGNINTGYQSQIDSVAGTTPKAIGYASGINSTGVSTLVGYYVKVGTTSNAALMSPSPTASALFFGDNGTSAVDLINLQSNATTAFSVTDAGIVKLGATSATPQHIVNSATGTTGTDILTLTNGVAGTAGNPAGYLKFTINGSTRYIPFW